MNFTARFKYLMGLPGKIYRQQPGRLTKSIELDQQNCFVKLHFGVGWKEIFKNLLQLRLPIIGAKTEYLALKKMQQLHIDSLEPVEFAESGINPATQQSYLVTKALQNMISLEDLCAEWQHNKPSIQFKRDLIRALAVIAKKLHDNGINHRDFYLCHFLFDPQYYQQTQKIKLYLIDLHRTQIRTKTPWRWQVKDIAGLYFSALKLPLTRRDLFCFMQIYDQGNKFWQEVEVKAWDLYLKTYFVKQKIGNKTILFDAAMRDQLTLEKFFQQPNAIIQQAQILKNDATTTVAKYSDFLVKRYNARSLGKIFKRLFRTSRARRCLMQALRLRHLGIATPKPIAIIEQLTGVIKRESYLVIEYLEGEDLLALLNTHPEKIYDVAEKIHSLFKVLYTIHTAHGDMKATNLWMAQQQIELLDLDGMRQYSNEYALKKALVKDKKRFLKNWQQHESFHQVFQHCLGKNYFKYFLDTRALACPQPVRETKLRLKQLTAGELLTVLCKDEITVLDLKAMCQVLNYEFVSSKQYTDYFEIALKVKA